MTGVIEVAGGNRLHHPSGVHHQHAVAKAAHQVDVVANKNQPQPARLNQIIQQAQHLQAHRHVQRGGRLIGNDQFRVGNQHHGDHDALPLSAGYFMRIKLINALRLANTHHLQHLQRLCLRLIFASRMMGQPGLGDLLTDADHRIKRIFRVLHNHGDTFAAHATHLRFSKMQQIEVGKLHPAGADAGLFRMQLQQGAPNGGFT